MSAVLLFDYSAARRCLIEDGESGKFNDISCLLPWVIKKQTADWCEWTSKTSYAFQGELQSEHDIVSHLFIAVYILSKKSADGELVVTRALHLHL